MKTVKGFVRLVGAGIVSVGIICLLLCFYNIMPVHIENKKGNTDYVWPANSVWVKATEGISFGRFDANGYNNLSVTENPDIIVLGSSHMEACEVMQDESAAYLLAQKLNGRYTVYNMGISGHDFYKVCQYLPENLELNDTVPKVVVIETSTVNISEENVDEILSHTVEFTPSHNTGVIGMLQKIPFCRAVYHQAEGGLLKLFMPDSGSSSNQTAAEDTVAEAEIDGSAYNELFSYLKDMEDKYGTQIIICYHPTEKLMDDGTVSFDSDEHLTAFKEYANKYGISFVDMTDRFENMYYEEHHAAHGFCTGELATGHLNKYGHAAMADEIYNEINNLEEAGELCQ